MFWYQKFLDNRGITILPNFFVSHRQKSSWAIRSVFQKYTGIKMFWITEVRRFCRLFCLTMPKIFAGGPLFFGYVLVSQIFWITSYHDFVETFCLTSPKIIMGEPFCVSELFWLQNVLDNRGTTILSIVLSHNAEKFRRRTPVFWICSGIEKFLDNKLSPFC